MRDNMANKQTTNQTTQKSLFSDVTEKKAGEISQTTIKEVQLGKRADFFGEEYWKASQYSPDQIEKAKQLEAIRVVAANGAKLDMTINRDESGKIVVSPKSTLAKYKKANGKYPEVGDQVNTQSDENGFFRFILA
jgi:uncharacterized protein YqjF (DUF2071 family)